MNTTLSHTSGPTDTPLLEITIGQAIDRALDRYPDLEALVDVPGGRRWSYRELVADVDALALALLDGGIRPGDRIGIWAPNSPEWTMVQFATARIGAILVTLNPAYRAVELEHAVNLAGIRWLFAVPVFKSSGYAAMIEEVAPRCSSLERTVFLGSTEWDTMLANGAERPRAELTEIAAGLAPEDPINIQFTSGTTGAPKGATLSHRNILNNGYFVGELLGYTEQDRICAPVPFFHCFGMVMANLAALTHGSCVVIPSAAFDPAAALAAVEQERCTSLYGVPTMYIAMLALDDFDSFDLSSLRTGAMAGSPCPIEVMKRVTGFAPEVAIAYGMTETSPAATQTRPHDSIERRVSTVGYAHPHVENKIIDRTTGETVPRGVPGELCMRGYSVMLGYWNQADKTQETIDDDGWIHSGDLAVMDDDGFVAITGRIKDLIVRGGENVYPREVEEFLYTHPDILDAQVIGVPSAKLGEEVMVWLRLRPGAADLDADAIREFCRDRLAHYKIPRFVHCVAEFPMTASGKIRKVDMREQSVELLGLTAV